MSSFCLLPNWMLTVPCLGPEWSVHQQPLARRRWDKCGGPTAQAGHSGLVVPLPRPWRELRGLKGRGLPQASASQGLLWREHLLPDLARNPCYPALDRLRFQEQPNCTKSSVHIHRLLPLQSPQTPFPCSVPSMALVSSVLGGQCPVPWHCSATALVAEDSGEVRGQHRQLRMAASAV